MSEENRDTEIRTDIEIRTHSEDADDYVKRLQEEIWGESDAKRILILLEKVRYWYWSALDWRGFYEAEISRRKEI